MVKASDISKSLKTTAEIISAVTAVVAVAGQLMDSVQPAIDGQQGKAVVEKTKDSLGQFKKRIMSFKDSHEENRNQKKANKEFAKQLEEGRKFVLESASQMVSYKDFKNYQEKEGVAGAALWSGLYKGSGCFVIATYPSHVFEKDCTSFENIYIGKGGNLGEAIDAACSRDGDPDVYADVKYKQNVKIFAYSCSEAELVNKYDALLALFQTDVDKINSI